MQTIGSFSASVICVTNNVLINNSKVIKNMISFKSIFSSTIAKTKVLLRIIINRTTGHHINGFDSISSEFTTRILPKDYQKSPKLSNIHQIINGLLNGERILLNRIVFKWNHSNRKPLIRSTALSLGLIGVCVKQNGPTLVTDTDVMETNCQQIRRIFNTYRELEFKSKELKRRHLSLNDIEFGSCIGKGCNGVVYNAKLKSDDYITDNELAVKMMFNYDTESNSAAVWNAMNKECVPFSGDFAPEDEDMNNICEGKSRRKLVPHPNIVDIYGVFADSMTPLTDAFDLYPDALPIRFGGFARNMTLFIVEKRYDMSLKQYLMTTKPTTYTSIAMLTQLLEAVSFLVTSKISHRDLKSDNILLSLNSENEIPWLVITDFGFCLTSLSVPFNCDEMSRGGNRALMAPEIISAKSGTFTRLDYTYADLWAIGAIAYELFNGLNPFYPYPERQKCLQSISYTDSQIPEPPPEMPKLIRTLVPQILSRNPYDRPHTSTALTICQIVLQMTDHMIQKVLSISSECERNKVLLYWLKTLSITTLCKRKTLLNEELLSNVDFKLRLMFLSQVKIERLINAFNFIAKNEM